MNKQQIEKALERIELQVKCNWWDNLLYFAYMTSALWCIIGILFSKVSYVNFAIIWLIVATILIQIAEKIQKNKIRRVYKNGMV